MRIIYSLLAVSALCLCQQSQAADAEYDIAVYGGTAGGAVAAVQAARMGKTVIVIEPSKHLGGLTSGGLGWTDSGNKAVIGGISREFYQRLKKHDDKRTAWTLEKAIDYKFYRPTEDAIWAFEPKIAEKLLREMLQEHKIPVLYGERLLRDPTKGITLGEQKNITKIVLESGKTVSAKMFIDATYEGDLLALAGVTFTVGREANSQYQETLNGFAAKWNTHAHRFVVKVDPYVKPGDPNSGLLPGIEAGPYPKDGDADHRMQAYCYRMCMSNHPDNRVPFPKPEGYYEKQYELLLRNFEAGDLRLPLKPDMMPNRKTDTNNNCAVSTDFIGQNYSFAKASYAEREKILQAHVTYQQGLMWTLANHPRVPEKIRKQMSVWGLAKDEFVDNGNWPHQIYVREARRMVSDYVVTERDCRALRDTPASVGMGSYNMDSHNCTRYVDANGFVQNEGDVQVSPGGPYRISYLSIVPKKGECPNLLVPVCVSSSHIAYGSIRMEPVFMILGQSAATAACMAIDAKSTVQDVPYEKLRERLLADKQVLEYARTASYGGIPVEKLPGIVVDDAMAERKGFQAFSSSVSPYVGTGYHHDEEMNPGKHIAVYRPKLPAAGKYEVRVAYTANGNRATKVPVMVEYDGGSKTVLVNQRKAPPIDRLFISVGVYEFDPVKPVSVTISNSGADGFVVIDAVQWLPVKK
ncbi:MAG: FAD-dependent oxidoreductase [Zavarzinella sp.]